MNRTRSLLRWPRSVAHVWLSAVLLGIVQQSAAVCTGDCNANGVVSAGEVTTIVARLLNCDGASTGMCGSVVAPDCTNADRNGNGIISAGEYTNAVANVLNGCPPTETPAPGTSTPPPATETPTAPPAATPTALMTAALPSPTSTSIAVSTATAPPTVTRTPTATPAATPTTRPAVCNNGILEAGETCARCAMDCKVKSCTPTTTVVTFNTIFSPPPGQDASSVTALVGYRSDRVSIPGKGTGSCKGGSNDGKACSTGTNCPGGQCTLPKSRIKNTPPGSIVGVNDLDYGVRVVLTRSGQIAAGRIFSVDFDTCQGAAAVTVADFGCTVEGCATSFGSIDGCTCTVVTP